MLYRLSCVLSLLFIISNCFASTYNVQLNVINKTGEAGYFSVAAQPVHPGSTSMSSIPQKIEPGFNRVFVPAYKLAYPVFTTMDEKAYTCGAQADPKHQLFIPIGKGARTVVITGFITDKDGNKAAIDCEVGQ